MQRMLTDQRNILKTLIDEVPPRALEAGQVRLALQNFALTTNNVTYAATGFDIGYWHFFPTGIDGQGIVPVWGTAVVAESLADTVQVGARYYGFYPMAGELVARPRVSSSGSVEDVSAHRAKLPAVYNRYMPVQDSTQDHMRALLQPLLATSWLLADWLRDNDIFGAKQVIVGSASSKTGLGLCAYLAEDTKRPFRVVGLTSRDNKGFVQDLGTCDSVLTYDEVGALSQIPSVYVDMAGNAQIKKALHSRLGPHLKHSAAVGISHWDKFAPPENLPGVKPQFFFAPAQIAKRREDWGPGVVEQEIHAAWARVAGKSATWLDVRVHKGMAQGQSIYQELARGIIKPHEGHIVIL